MEGSEVQQGGGVVGAVETKLERQVGHFLESLTGRERG